MAKSAVALGSVLLGALNAAYLLGAFPSFALTASHGIVAAVPAPGDVAAAWVGAELTPGASRGGSVSESESEADELP